MRVFYLNIYLASWLRFSVLAVLFAVAVSCGGGGGGGGNKLVYITDWTNRGRAPTGLSQRIRIFDTQENLEKSVVMNQDANSVQQVDISLGSGTFHLSVELFSQRDLAGTRTGVLDTFVTVSGAAAYRTAVGEDPTSVGITPSSATFQAGHSKQFYATAFSAPGRAVFVEPDTFTWTTLGGTASVNDNGLVFGLSEGPGTVRATHDPSGLQGSAVFTITPLNTTTSKWTVIVFLNAANDLFNFSDLNVNQMERVAQSSDVRFVLQWKQVQSLFPTSSFDGTRRYLVKPDTSNDIVSELLQDMGDGVDMGDSDVLHDFILWAKTNYPAERYCLVVWNHGNGWRRGVEEDLPTRAVSYDDETGNSIQIWEMAQALGGTLFDIVAFDASLMQMMEVADEIRDQAKYVVGSEESPPGEGYPYHLIFDNFKDNPTDTTLNLSKAFVDGMLEVPEYATRKITQSVVDTTKLDELESSLDGLADALIANVGSIGAQVQAARSNAQSYSPSGNRVYRDIDHLCEILGSTISIPAIQTAASSVRTSLADAVVWEGHNANSPNSNGLSIDFSSSAQFASGALDYSLLRFASATSWNEWLSAAP
jgi:hypothetical protein